MDGRKNVGPLDITMTGNDLSGSPEFERNVKEQYETLGRFVEAFELMVHEVRELIITVCSDCGRFPNDTQFETIVHHQALTAKPLMDILRAVVADVLQTVTHCRSSNMPLDNDHPLWTHTISEAEGERLLDVLGFVASKYEKLVNRRNDLLHGTWFVGYGESDNPEGAEFYIRRFRTTAKGLTPASGLPKTASELRDFTKRCTAVRDWISKIDAIVHRTEKVGDAFEFTEKMWWLIATSGAKVTLL
ncbi:hypothetical protein ACVIGB_006504 [Bradyrhizobium sp. USDA 4341]